MALSDTFVKGVTIRVRKERIGTEDPPIMLTWEEHMAPLAPKATPGRLQRRKKSFQYAHEVELIGPCRIVHINPDPGLRPGSIDCDVNPLRDQPRVVIEATDARIVR